MDSGKTIQTLEESKKEFMKRGFTIVCNPRLRAKAAELDQIFEKEFKSRFSENIRANRSLIKAFGRTPSAISFYNDKAVFEFCKIISMSYPVFCGPLVTHYTSTDPTGNGYGLPFHQDYASMAGSLNSIVLWSSLKNVDSEAQHSLNVVSGMHNRGMLPGKETKEGYILERQDFEGLETTITLQAGDILIMSAFTPHKTHFGNKDETYKLSLSTRIDDLNSSEWKKSDYRSAYSTAVDRNLYKEVLNQSKLS